MDWILGERILQNPWATAAVQQLKAIVEPWRYMPAKEILREVLSQSHDGVAIRQVLVFQVLR